MHEVTKQAINRDIILAEGFFGEAAVLWPSLDSLEDDSDFWIRIEGYRLPPFYNRSTTGILIVMPPRYGLVDVSLEEFYLYKYLRVNTRNGWKVIPHYYPEDYNKYSKEGWGWYCIHPKSWKKTDNILTFLKLIDLMLQQPFKWNT